MQHTGMTIMHKRPFIPLAVLAFSLPAVAQTGEEPAAPAAPSQEAASGQDKGNEVPKEGEAAAEESADAAVPPRVTEETIYVVQGKPYLVQGHFEVTPQIAQTVNDQFTSHTGLMLSGIYHLKENVALEVVGGVFAWWDNIETGATTPRLGGRDTDLTIELREKENLAPERVKLYQFPWLLASDLQWSPLYGKVSLQDIVLGQFNLYLSVGAGVVGLQLETLTPSVPQKTFVPLKGPFDGAPAMALTTSFGGGLRFYFTDWLGIRLEVRDYVTPLGVTVSGANAVDDADAPTFDVTNTVLGQVGVSFVF